MMLDRRLPWLWALILGLVATAPSPDLQSQIPPITDPKFIEDCVKTHNELRSQVSPASGNMRYMTWDEALAKTARGWARKCVFQHNIHIGKKHACHPVFKNVGENLWMGTLSNHVPQSAINAWYNETKYYDLGSNSCTKVCGHYTQVVWATTYKVGCALKLCPNLGKRIAIFLCNYAPPGNMVGRRPYLKETACGACEEGDICENELCKNTVRDKILSYPYWNPSWEVPRRFSCNPYCQFYLPIRLIGMVLAVLGVFIVQIKYPSLHLMH
ncbi:GLIPR1-like protein 1 [Dromiciops gliroides]|uniref:GLIPR1-like protein 1 n=1 Tax=Dromiciops gliroides TaxID=33562 RepID=UPI001CC7FF55|nr:GLIPR1-like protein 1 [Dromiciops gliroides]